MISETLQLTNPDIPIISTVSPQPSFSEWNIEAPQFRNGKFIKPSRVTNSTLVESTQARSIDLAPNTQFMFQEWSELYKDPAINHKKNLLDLKSDKWKKMEGEQPELAPYQVLNNTIQLIADVEFALSSWNEEKDSQPRVEEFRALRKRDKEIPKHWESFGAKDRKKVDHPLTRRLLSVIGIYYGFAMKDSEIVQLLEDDRKI